MVDEMDVKFSDLALARLCNSQKALTRKLGDSAGRILTKRLCDLAAIDVAGLGHLPHTQVDASDDGWTRLAFDELVVIEGVLSRVGDEPEAGEGGRIVITSVNLEGAMAQ